MGGNSKRKISYFIKEKQNENVNTSSPRHTRARTLKTQKTCHTKLNRERINKKISTFQISTDIRHSDSKSV